MAQTTQTTLTNQGNPVRRAEETLSGPVFTPPVDILEDKDDLVLVADMPGVQPDAVDIQYEQGVLTVRGRVAQREPAGRVLLQEYRVGDYHRAFTIGEGIDVTRIEAQCRDGVLRIRLPKAEAVKPRRIQVQS